jgi:hypothetical protein
VPFDSVSAGGSATVNNFCSDCGIHNLGKSAKLEGEAAWPRINARRGRDLDVSRVIRDSHVIRIARCSDMGSGQSVALVAWW